MPRPPRQPLPLWVLPLCLAVIPCSHQSASSALVVRYVAHSKEGTRMLLMRDEKERTGRRRRTVSRQGGLWCLAPYGWSAVCSASAPDAAGVSAERLKAEGWDLAVPSRRNSFFPHC